MKGYLKGAGLIPQCVRCWSLRDVEKDKECPTCADKLNVVVTEVRWLVLNDVSHDLIDSDTYGVISAEQLLGLGEIN